MSTDIIQKKRGYVMKRIITMLLCVCLLCSSTLYFAEEPISGADGEVVTVPNFAKIDFVNFK